MWQWGIITFTDFNIPTVRLNLEPWASSKTLTWGERQREQGIGVEQSRRETQKMDTVIQNAKIFQMKSPYVPEEKKEYLTEKKKK